MVYAYQQVGSRGFGFCSHHHVEFMDTMKWGGFLNNKFSSPFYIIETAKTDLHEFTLANLAASQNPPTPKRDSIA